MGLDTVELVVRFENAFGIAIPDDVAVQLTTPRRVSDYILAQVTVSEQPSCLSQQAFYFLREKYARALNISRRHFSPNTKLESLISTERRRHVWAAIRLEIGASAVPDLARPIWLFAMLSILAMLTFISALTYAWSNFNVGSGALLFGMLAAIVVGYSGALVTRPLKQEFRRGYQCAGDLANYLSVHAPHVFKREPRGWTREQVTAIVREIIVEQTGLKDFSEDSHFIDDVHLD